MLYLVLSAFILFPVWIGFGKLWKTTKEGLAYTMIMGIFTLSTLWTLVSFFVPLNLYVESLSVIIGFLLFFYYQGFKNIYSFLKGTNLVLLGLTCIFILAISSFYPYILDHFGYYIPSIQWLTEAGLVKGMANLDLILGQMSIWHIFQAGFSSISDPFLRINAFLLILYSIYIFEKKQWFQLCFIPILVAFTQSPSPDLPVIVFSIILVNEIIHQNKNVFLLFALSSFIFAIKPTAIWVPLFSFLYGIFILKKNIRFLSLGLVIIGLFIYKNIWTFGYPIFPMDLIDFNLSWKVNPDLLKSSSQLALEKTYNLQYTYQEIIAFSWKEKIIKWFTLEGIKGKIHLAFLFMLVVFGIFSFSHKKSIYRWLFFAILMKTLIVLAFSAQYRFLLDVFFIGGAVSLSPLFNHRKSIYLSSALGLISLLLFISPVFIQKIAPSFNLGFMMKSPEWKVLYQPLEYHYKKYDTFRIGNLTFHVSKDYPFNFDTPTPAISATFLEEYLHIGIFPQRSEQGFIWTHLNDYQKRELKTIMATVKGE